MLLWGYRVMCVLPQSGIPQTGGGGVPVNSGVGGIPGGPAPGFAVRPQRSIAAVASISSGRGGGGPPTEVTSARSTQRQQAGLASAKRGTILTSGQGLLAPASTAFKRALGV